MNGAQADEIYHPTDGSYVAFPGIFATWLGAHCDPPNPCRKYHVSSALGCAGGVAAAVLPVLRDMRLNHKVVRRRSGYARMQAGDQAGKFITIYAALNIDHEGLVAAIDGAVAGHPELAPSPTVPRSRRHHHVFAEQPWGERMFLYGGYETDPSD